MRDNQTITCATDVLSTGDPVKKARNARAFRAFVLADPHGPTDQTATLTDRPARPERPRLVPPSRVARRGLGKAEGRAALLHAIAHIELNAIDLAADMIARFSHAPELSEARTEFVRDWSSVCDDEARHFLMIQTRLNELGSSYGDFDAHDGLWDAALATKDNLAARLAIAPLVLEARGLDVTPGMIEKLTQAEDHASADILKIIYKEEIAHVATGMRWFSYVAEKRSLDPESFFHELVRQYFKGRVKPPFNREAREKAGFPASFYSELAYSSA